MFVLLTIGVILWWDAHLFKRLLPGPRAILTERLGDASKGVIALMILGSIVLMVIGYRGADFVPVYDPPGWAVHVNNLLMLFAIMLFGMGSSKGRLRAAFRHPMTMGFTLWGIAHLLVNGDLASIILFGGLAAWGPVAILMINRAEPNWTRPAPGPAKGDVRLVVISVVLYAIIGAIHGWIGPWPFPS